jgi:alpha-ketoglutarate-dependent taurine dioxygenase
MTVVPLTATIGAVIEGVDLSTALDGGTIATIRAALVRHRVVFFRDQDLTPTQQVTFARRFGPLTPAHPLVPGLDEDHPEILVLDSRDYPLGVGDRTSATSYNNRWHTDVTFSATPPTATVLAAKIVPAYGGDTLWADLIDAYRSLSAPIRDLLDGLVAIHDAHGTFDRFRADDPTGVNQATLATLAPVRHPVVRVHPESGERGLFVNPTFTSHIEGLSGKESATLLALLYDHSVEPERVVRWRWRAGDVAFWDNRSTCHYAAADYGTETRLMHRVTIAGDAPY